MQREGGECVGGVLRARALPGAEGEEQQSVLDPKTRGNRDRTGSRHKQG